MMTWALWLLGVSALPILIATAYLAVLTLASGRLPPAAPVPPTTSFDVVVPAHDEEAGIGRTVRSLLALDHPRDRFRVLVVADNCTDATAERARAAGAHVLVRDDPDRRGKGYALEHAFTWSLADGFARAVVVVDADTVVRPNLLRAFDARLVRGAQAVQAEYGVANPDDSWRTQLMTLAFTLFHRVRSTGRERLGLSTGLRGNGMCFSHALLREHPHRAFSVVEDLEYAVQLGEAGVRVEFAPEAQVLGEMVAHERGSRSQRQRWEQGRGQLVRRLAPRLLASGLARRDPLRLDLAMDLLVPPLAQLGGWIGIGCSAAAGAIAAGAPAWVLLPWVASLVMLGGYVARGWQLAGLGWRGVGAVARAPLYLGWKLVVALAGGRVGNRWVRTSRGGGGEA